MTPSPPRVKKDMRLDPWILPKGALGSLSDQLSTMIESKTSGRKRKDAIERRRVMVAVLIANLRCLVLSPVFELGDHLMVPTAKTKLTRYNCPSFSKELIKNALNGLVELDVITLRSFKYKQLSTAIAPTSSFLETLKRTASPQDIEQVQGGETIWLSARTGSRSKSWKPPAKPPIEYHDTAVTHYFRKEMEEINRYMNKAHISFDGQVQPPVYLRRHFLIRDTNSPHTFNLNGRLTGGFWLNLPSRQRHKLRLRGEPVADLDFVGMFPSLAYMRSDGVPLEFDPYAIPGLEGHRAGAKLGLLSLLSRTTDMKRLTPELKEVLPPDWTAKRLKVAIEAYHPRISHLFGTDVGVDLMFIESQILVALLLRLSIQDIPALPMHDGIMVRRRDIDAATLAMHQASQAVTGTAFRVIEKTITN